MIPMQFPMSRQDGYAQRNQLLCGVVHDWMEYDVRLGDVLIFINRSRTTMKLLHAEDEGMALYVKHLEEGTFRLPAYNSESRSYPMWNGETWS